MNTGPIIIFDKSTLQSLSLDEAVWLDIFYRTNITPLFFIETLADLEKQIKSRRTPEQVVGDMARKTPEMASFANAHHTTLCLGDLLGHEVKMIRLPVISGGTPVTTGDKKGVYYKQTDEIEALQRWKQGDFINVERQYAKVWRQALAVLDFESMYREFKSLFGTYKKPRSLTEVKTLIENLIDMHGRKENVFNMALDFMNVIGNYRSEILKRWKAQGQPPLDSFAPYASYVFKVDFFFYCSLASDLISKERPSNRIDLAYLYYLPFCMIFFSNDKLHSRTVPLFLQENQLFINGKDLKDDLGKLDEYYSRLPDETKKLGIINFAAYPPQEGNFLVSQFWDTFCPSWRSHAAQEIKITKELEQKIVGELKQMKKMAKPMESVSNVDLDNTDNVVFERKVPAQKGKWRILPPNIE